MAQQKLAASADDIMTGAEMRPLLMKSRQEDVHCAIGLTDAKDAVILLHRRTKGLRLVAELRKTAKDAGLGLDNATLRFGVAAIDAEAGLVTFRINKGLSGPIEMKLKAQLKGSGCKAAEVVVDESLGEDAPAATEAGSAVPPAPDPAALIRVLTAIGPRIPQIAGTDAALQATLSRLATQAAIALKAGDAAAAVAPIGQLRQAAEAAAKAQVAPSVQANMADCVARMKAVRDDALLYGQLDGFADGLRDAASALKAGDAAALGMIGALEARMAAAAAAKRAQEAAEMATRLKTGSGMGSVAFNKLRLQLYAAQSRFDGAVENLKVSCAALLETSDFLDDPRSQDPDTLTAIERLDERLPSMGGLVETIEDAIDRMSGTLEPSARQQHADAALKAIAAFGAALEAEPLLTEMEQTDAGSFSIHGTMTAVLDELSAALRG